MKALRPTLREPEPAADLKLVAWVLAVLRQAGRPVTRGEMGMFGAPVAARKAAELQRILDALVDAGRVEVGSHHDTKTWRTYVTYVLMKGE